MKTETRTDIPDSTYFTASDVAPYVQGKTLYVFNGKGSRRGWGAPEVTSTIVVNTATFTAVHVGFHHKHRGGQQWYYFVDGERQTWAQLSDKRRQQVLDNKRNAPSWANVPGSLRKERKHPQTQIGYKLVQLNGDKLVSLFDGETEYQIGKRLAQKAQPDHNGGYYAYPSAEGCKNLLQQGKLVPASCMQGVTRLALLEVEMGGRILNYGEKLAATYLKPVRILETIELA